MTTSDPTVQSLLIADAMEGAPAAVFVADDRRRLLAVNRFACDLLGYTREELLALRADQIAAHDDAVQRFATLHRERHLEGETTLRQKSGELVQVHYRAGETTVSGLSFWVGVALPL